METKVMTPENQAKREIEAAEKERFFMEKRLEGFIRRAESLKDRERVRMEQLGISGESLEKLVGSIPFTPDDVRMFQTGLPGGEAGFEKLPVNLKKRLQSAGKDRPAVSHTPFPGEAPVENVTKKRRVRFYL